MTLPVYSVSWLLFVTSFCVPNEADYYFSSFCNDAGRRNSTIYLASSETGYIKAKLESSTYSAGLDCTLTMNPPSGYGITLNVERIDLRRNFDCEDTITIQRSDYTYGPWFTELSRTCDLWFRPPEYNSEGPMRINFQTVLSSSHSTYGKDFRIFYATYNKQKVGAIIGGVVGSIVFVAVVVGIVFLCRRRRMAATSTCTTTVCPPPMAYPQQNYASPQPYGYQQQQVPQQTHY